ncbi:hypothetical protein AMAG_07096 [Allomyces macrogynus ATCC 38327]|uniref:Uncharacterized protein n=1 Tax=Allomyces macrogynus (strain ATCC 38327) TaxID=578462 RepID=A0A0L0SH30_ALLM3|nr:hypothetical protein AMAG_07096 [Allomyces macrogynus ATCC 38327]|eukprot:KNE61818.1 hypothetical protein AMAG_07096 [Allomyces macrogynus ATCC 38327]
MAKSTILPMDVSDMKTDEVLPALAIAVAVFLRKRKRHEEFITNCKYIINALNADDTAKLLALATAELLPADAERQLDDFFRLFPGPLKSNSGFGEETDQPEVKKLLGELLGSFEQLFDAEVVDPPVKGCDTTVFRDFAAKIGKLACQSNPSQIYFPGTAVIQSSGFGKSRISTQALTNAGTFTLYLNMNKNDSTGYPRPTPGGILRFLHGSPDDQLRPMILITILLHAAAVAEKVGVPPSRFLELQVVRATRHDDLTARFFELVEAAAKQLLTLSLKSTNKATSVLNYLGHVFGHAQRTKDNMDEKGYEEIAVVTKQINDSDISPSSPSSSLPPPSSPSSLPSLGSATPKRTATAGRDQTFQESATWVDLFALFEDRIRNDVFAKVERQQPSERLQPQLRFAFVLDEARSLYEGNTFHAVRRCFRTAAVYLKSLNTPLASGAGRTSGAEPNAAGYVSPFFVLFLDTVSRIGHFTPIPRNDPSARVARLDLPTHGPIFYIALADALAYKWADADVVNMAQAFVPGILFRFGRPLWAIARREASNCICLAAVKLLGTASLATLQKFQEKPTLVDLISDTAALALVRHRLPFHVHDTQLAEDMVATRMAVCTRISANRSIMHITALSEPVLAEAIAWIWSDYKACVQTVEQFAKMSLRGAQISVGNAGEIAAMLLLLLAHDHAAMQYGPNARAVGGLELRANGNPQNLNWVELDGYVNMVKELPAFFATPVPVAVLFRALWGTAFDGLRVELGPSSASAQVLDRGMVSMTHFVELDYVPEPRHMLANFCRACAVKCKANNAGYDLLIPVLMPQEDGRYEVHVDAITFLAIQVKNHAKHPFMATDEKRSKLNSTLDSFYGNWPAFPTHPYVAVYLVLQKAEQERTVLHVYNNPTDEDADVSIAEFCAEVEGNMGLLSAGGQIVRTTPDAAGMKLSVQQEARARDVWNALQPLWTDPAVPATAAAHLVKSKGGTSEGSRAQPAPTNTAARASSAESAAPSSLPTGQERPSSSSSSSSSSSGAGAAAATAAAAPPPASEARFVEALRMSVRKRRQVAIAAIGFSIQGYPVLREKWYEPSTTAADSLAAHDLAKQFDLLLNGARTPLTEDEYGNLAVPAKLAAYDAVIDQTYSDTMMTSRERVRSQRRRRDQDDE